MTVAEIVRKLLAGDPRYHNHLEIDEDGKVHPIWSESDYEKAWLVMELISNNQRLYDVIHNKGWFTAQKKALKEHNISPSDYAELERRVREWEGK